MKTYNTIYKCKYKNNIKLQKYIIKKYKIYWYKDNVNDIDFYDSYILNINNNRSRFNDIKFQDDDEILLYISNYITYSKYNKIIDFQNNDVIDFEQIIRKEKLKRLQK